jgi:hypothetical protein
MKQLKWLAFAVLVLFLSWRIVVVNISQQLAAKGSLAATQWKWDTPSALLNKAASLAQTDPNQARILALEAAKYNPANGGGFLLLAAMWEQEGKARLARKAADMAHFLAPRNADVQLPLGTFWAQRGQPIQALSHWSAAIEARPALSVTLFPVMLAIVDVPQMRLRYAQALRDAPTWWGSFFMYALNNAAHEETLKAIYNVRADKVGHAERSAYLDHLINNGLYTDAFFVWLNGLQASQISALGNVYDGGFEQMIDDEGFGWRPLVANGFKLATEPTYGNTGKNALHVALQETLPSRTLIYQTLMLDTGQYRLQGRVRLDNLSAGKGLQWALNCSDQDGKVLLVSSEHFIGADEWKKFESEFTVPVGKCAIQVLQLQIDAGVDTDQSTFAGSAWFDDLEIVNLTNK